MTIYRLRALLGGWTGGPGVTTFWLSKEAGADQESLSIAAAELANFYTAIDTLILGGVTMDVDPVVDELDPATGALLEAHPIVAPDSWLSTGGSSFTSRATQIVARLQTGGIVQHEGPPVRSRRLQGRHFHGPLASSALDANGQVTIAASDILTGAYQALLPALDNALCVWHRPVQVQKPGGPAPTVGLAAPVTAVTVMGRPGVLRSRRD